MPRDGRIVRARLQQAALELFTERGFDQTTAMNIAERAGVTERTFFRHFVDKREVFFDGERELSEDFGAAFASLPPDLDAMPTLLAVFHHTVPILERNRTAATSRTRVIRETPALHERELAKGAALVGILSQQLVARGIEPIRATFAALIGMDVYAIAVRRWHEDDRHGLHEDLDQAFEELRSMANSITD